MGISSFVSKDSSLNLFVLGLVLAIYGFLVVKSQSEIGVNTSTPVTTPPPHDVGNTSPPPPPPPPPLPPPPHDVVNLSPRPRPRTRSPPPLLFPAPPPRMNNKAASNRKHHGQRGMHRPPPPSPSWKPPHKGGLNTGKMVGLLFAGFAGVLQVCVGAFLVFKRKQLLKMKDRY